MLEFIYATDCSNTKEDKVTAEQQRRDYQQQNSNSDSRSISHNSNNSSMNSILLSILVVSCAVSTVYASLSSFDQTNEGNEFYVGFFHNRFGRAKEPEKYPPVLWITTKEITLVEFTVSTINETIFTGFAKPHKVTYVSLSTGIIVSDSTQSNTAEWFKGIHIKTKDGKNIVVYGQHEQIASNDAYLALPVITLPGERSHEYIVASVNGDKGAAAEAKDSVALIVGTENDTEIVINPSVVIPNGFAPAKTGNNFLPGAPASLNTITIHKFQTFYLQVRGGDISGTRITANKPISVFSGHECANVPLNSEPCDMLIEQVPSIDTWGTEVVTIPLKTKKGDVIKVIASQDDTIVNITRTNFDHGTVTRDPSFTLNAGQFKEIVIRDFSLIQSNHPIGVFQIGTSFKADNVIQSDPLMLLVPPREQYHNSYAVATAPFEPSLSNTLNGRVAYVNYTNIAVPAEYFNASLIIINNKSVDASDFKPIRRADKSIWGYGARLLLDEGAQIIRHQIPNAVLSTTIYGFSNQQSWGCTGGMGLASVAVAVVKSSDVTVFEDDGVAVIQIERSGPLNSEILIHVSTVNETAIAGVDYTKVSQEVKFAPGQSTASVSIPIKDDDIALEQNVTFSVTIIPKGDVIVLSNSTVTIVDNDHVPRIRINNMTVFENDGTVNIQVERSEGLHSRISINIKTVDGSALAGRDYTTVSREIIFLPGQSEVSVTISIVDDTTPQEPDIFFFVYIIFNGDTIAQSVVTIADNDHDTVVEFSSSRYIGSESLKGVPVTLVITKGTINIGEQITVNIVATDHSPVIAEGHGKDYSSMLVPVTFTNTNTKVLSVIPVFQDKIVENIETFDLSIDIPSSVRHRISLGRQRKAIASIIDSTIINCPANFKLIAMQKTTSNKIVRKEVRSTIKNVLDLTENVTTDEEAFNKIATKIEIKNTTENFVQFQNAVNEISEASYEACYGPKSKLVFLEETQVLIDSFEKALEDKKSAEARRIFGRLLCLRQKFQTNTSSVTKRQTPTLDPYEVILEMWFDELEVDHFPSLFNFDGVEERSIAFVVDDTGSMGGEIDAVKDLINAIIKAERSTPYFYILGTFNDPEVGDAKIYNSYNLDELDELKSDVEALRALGGGDCPELGMEGILRALALSSDESHVIVLTDASCKDCERRDDVVYRANLANIKIHFFFSGSGCDDDFADYRYVQSQTGGISISSIESFESLTLFITELSSEESKRSIRSIDSIKPSSLLNKCQTFNISIFTSKFELIINHDSASTTIYDPLGYNVKNHYISDDLTGYISNGQPRNGSWRICTVDETSKFTVTKRDILDFTVDYYQDGHYSTAIPTAGNVSILSAFTTQLDNLLVDDSLTLSFLSEDNEFLGSTPLLLCNGYLLGRIVIPNVKFIYRLSGNDKFGNPFVYTKRSPVNTPRKPYFLENVLSSSGRKTINIGSKASIYFSLKSTYAATSPLSFNIAANTSPSELLLKYQTTITVEPNDTEIVIVSIQTKDTDTEGDYVVKVTASSEDLILTSSQNITLVKPDDEDCPCLNGGTCRYISRRGRTFIHCLCTSEYFGSRCQLGG